MANVRLSIAANQAAMNAVTALLDAANPLPGYCHILSGTQPATGYGAIVPAIHTVLATLVLPLPAALQANTTGRSDFASAFQDANPDNAGTAVWARFYDGNGNAVFDCDVDVAGATITLSSTAITTPGLVIVHTFYLQHPDGA